MPENIKKGSLTTIIGTGVAIVTFVASTIGLWMNIETKIRDTVTASTIQITKEIKSSTFGVVELHRDDLEIRIRILKQEIASKNANGIHVPERTTLFLQALEDQVEELKDKWYHE